MWNALPSTHPFALLCGDSHMSFMRAPRDAMRHTCVAHGGEPEGGPRAP